MQARRSARELALILFSQSENKILKYKKNDYQDIILKSVRTLISNAKDELELVISEVNKIKDAVEELEANHEENLKRPLDTKNVPVKMPLTSDMIEYLDTMINAGEKSCTALEISELATLSQKDDVREYIEKIVETYKKENEQVDNTIKELSVGWNLDRLFKIDKNILRIAIVELVYIKEVPHKVVIDEAVELAKKYSTDDSPSFINGILAKVVSLNV